VGFVNPPGGILREGHTGGRTRRQRWFTLRVSRSVVPTGLGHDLDVRVPSVATLGYIRMPLRDRRSRSRTWPDTQSHVTSTILPQQSSPGFDTSAFPSVPSPHVSPFRQFGVSTFRRVAPRSLAPSPPRPLAPLIPRSLDPLIPRPLGPSISGFLLTPPTVRCMLGIPPRPRMPRARAGTTAKTARRAESARAQRRPEATRQPKEKNAKRSE